MDIDLRRCWSPLLNEVGEALNGFARQHPNVQISTVGLWGDGFHGMATLHLDTLAHSAAHLAEFSGSARHDAAGRFCVSVNDFEYHIGEFSFPDFPDLYDHPAEAELAFISLEGVRSVVDPSKGDPEMDLFVLPFLKRLIASFEPFPQLTHAEPLRVVIEMHGSGDIEYWRVRSPGEGQ